MLCLLSRLQAWVKKILVSTTLTQKLAFLQAKFGIVTLSLKKLNCFSYTYTDTGYIFRLKAQKNPIFSKTLDKVFPFS